MADGSIGLWTVPLAVFGGAIRVSTPFLFVSLGECITERSGRINLGLEGTLVMGAMSAYGISYLSASPWLGVLAAAGQRHRRRHRADAVRDRPCFLSRKTPDRTDRAATACDRFRRLERHPATAGGVAHQCHVPDRIGAGADPVLGLPQHALGPSDPHRRRKF